MSPRVADGEGLLAAFHGALDTLEQSAEAINALNVFPVPDGDTGSNMLATLRAAITEAEALRPEERTVGGVAAAIGHGALMGARGNSGVILSQILLGIAGALAGRQRMSALDLAHALATGSQTAHNAVLKPVEGTILTVVREASAAAVAAAEHDPDLEAVLGAAVEAAEEAVARSPSLLPVLREAGVVDAGGEGLHRILQGALRGTVTRRPVPAEPGEEARVAAVIARGDEGYGYETMFLVTAAPGHALDLDAMRARLCDLGESVLVAGDVRAAKIHVHNERPDLVIGYGLTLGPLSHVSVENLDRQAREAREARAHAFTGTSAAPAATDAVLAGAAAGGGAREMRAAASGAPSAVTTAIGIGGTMGAAAGDRDAVAVVVPQEARAGTALAAEVDRLVFPVHDATEESAPAGTSGNGHGPAVELPGGDEARRVPHAGPPIVAVASGEGIVAILRSFGVAQVVGGGQAANPSAGEILRAAQGLGTEDVLVLPNNPNVKLAAQQAAALALGTRIVVVPTRNAPEGFAALLAYDAGRDAEENAATMLAAARSIQTLQVTDAVRDARLAGHKVRKGHAIVLDPDDGLVAAGADRFAAVLDGVATLHPGFELLTVYYGDGADLAEAETLVSALQETLPDVEVELVHGGQPHYRYILAAE